MATEQKSRRYRVVNFAPEFIGEIATLGWRVPFDGMQSIECQIGLPPGARYVGQFYNGAERCVSLVFEHESFDEVPDHRIPPSQQVQFVHHIQPARQTDGEPHGEG